MQRDIVARVMYALFALYMAVAAFGAPDSLAAFMVDFSGVAGGLISCGTAALAVALLADVVVNDVMPTRFALPWAVHLRHWFYVGVAFGYLVPPFVAVQVLRAASVGFGDWAVYALHVGMACFGVVLALRDALQKHRTQRGMVCNKLSS
ncbi:hypothetical protein PPN31114_03500 [Pandoraea pneumonica]|uniref:Uncharacterized protein n=1 Tax=Pandoraea pneumonica TaxID=2508299 RepID=A0A5E4WY95_9BURK|nr:hypothetical protein [Pandoraea pneumonica]VVE27966.1 hypothetical protein PPN31114_03500 [Pandoraea pneumonica]